ncbi:MAG: tyrosine-type recombinase/integrase, partial [Alphaproteobacteria bacterium]
RLGNYMVALRAQAGLGGDVTFHAFRHTTTTHMVNDAVDIMEVSQRLGHKSIAVTERVYNHHKPEFQKKSTNSIDSLL